VFERSRTRTRTRRGGGRWLRATLVGLVLLLASAAPIPPRYNPGSSRFGLDKALHAVGHAGFVVALLAALDDGGGLRVAAVAVLVSTVHAAGAELLQEAVPGRAFEPGDVVAGLLGSSLGAAWWRAAGARTPA
jgi:VanZ family protein